MFSDNFIAKMEAKYPSKESVEDGANDFMNRVWAGEVLNFEEQAERDWVEERLKLLQPVTLEVHKMSMRTGVK